MTFNFMKHDYVKDHKCMCCTISKSEKRDEYKQSRTFEFSSLVKTTYTFKVHLHTILTCSVDPYTYCV